MDNSRQVIQTSKPYDYGMEKPLKTKEEAMEEIQKLEQKVKTDIALKKIYEFSEVKIIEGPGAIQLVVTTIVPKVMN